MKKGARESTKKHNACPAAVICSVLGTALLCLVVLACLATTVPRIFGIQSYTVLTGSMEPNIPTGSLVYIKSVEPEDLAEGDVITFYEGTHMTIVTHRIESIDVDAEKITTKGDANDNADFTAVPYDHVIGKVIFHIPSVGGYAFGLASVQGKISCCVLVIGAVLLIDFGSRLKKKKTED